MQSQKFKYVMLSDFHLAKREVEFEQRFLRTTLFKLKGLDSVFDASQCYDNPSLALHGKRPKMNGPIVSLMNALIN